MTKIAFIRLGSEPPYDYSVIINGQERAKFSRGVGRKYYLYTLDNEMLRQNYSPVMAHQAEFEPTILQALECNQIPDAEGYEKRKAERRAKLAAKIADWQEKRMRDRYADHGAAMLAVLKDAVRIADEAREEWDKEPATNPAPRAGKILIALAGGIPGYRADTDAIHKLIAEMDAPAPEPDESLIEHFTYDVKRETGIWGNF